MPLDRRHVSDMILMNHVPEAARREVLRFFYERRLAAGEILWAEGDPAKAMAVLVTGRLTVVVDGHRVGRVEVGQLVGEGSVLLEAPAHRTTIRATEPSEVLLLGRHILRRLRAAHPEMHASLVKTAISTAARRMRAAGSWFGHLAEPEEETPSSSALGWLEKAWRRWVHTDVHGVPQPLREVASGIPVLKRRPPAVSERLLRAFEPRAIRDGEVVVRQSQPGGTAFLLADGAVSVLREQDRWDAHRLATLRPGDLFGVASFMSGGHHSATCRAVMDGWVYALEREAYEDLDPEAKALWHEVVLHELTRVILHADRQLVATGSPEVRPDLRGMWVDDRAPRPTRLGDAGR